MQLLLNIGFPLIAHPTRMTTLCDMINTLKLKSVLFLVLAGLLLSSIAETKRLVPLTSFENSETGNLRRRALMKRGEDGGLQVVQIEKSDLEEREAKRLPLDLDNTSPQGLGKREAKKLPSDIENIIESLEKKEAKKLPFDLDEILEGLEKRQVPQQEFGSTNEDGTESTKMVYLDSRIPLLNEISIFSSYSRNDLTLSSNFEDPKQNVIVFAPSNDAIEALSLKPWQFPINIDELESNTEDEKAIDDAVNNNIIRFVRSHVVSYSDSDRAFKHNCKHREILLKSQAYDGPQDSGDIILKKEKDDYYVASAKDHEFHIVKKIDHAENGVVMVIDSCLESP